MSGILHKVTRDDVIAEPFPHVVVDDALDAKLYAELAASFPPGEIVVDGREVRNNAAYHMRAARMLSEPRVAPCWKEFARQHTSADFCREVVAIFGDSIRALHPHLEEQLGRRLEEARTSIREAEPFADLALDCQATWGSPVLQPSRSHPCHVDRPVALFAGLLYCKLPEDDADGFDATVRVHEDASARFKYTGYP